MELTQRDIDMTAEIMWENVAKAAARFPAEAAEYFNTLAIKYGAFITLFISVDEENERFFRWLQDSAYAMANYYRESA